MKPEVVTITLNEKIEKINELISDIKENAVINVVDENGNDTDLYLDCIEVSDMPNEISAWCHSNTVF